MNALGSGDSALWIAGALALFALPVAFIALTAFVKIATVLQIVRAAVGAYAVPSNAIVLALSVALTFVAMAPLVETVSARLAPALSSSAQPSETWLSEVTSAVLEPVRGFLEANTTDREKQRFAALLVDGDRIAGVSDSDFRILIPGFLVSELLRAFTLGFAIYLPLLVIDLVVANVLVGLGMAAMSPEQVSLPFKLLLFVATDGWGLLAQTLVTGYRF